MKNLFIMNTAAMLLAFERSISENAEMSDILRRAVNNDPQKFAATILSISDVDDDDEDKLSDILSSLERLSDLEIAKLLNAIEEFGPVFVEGLPKDPMAGFNNFLEEQNSVTNQYASRAQIIHSLFNHHNYTGNEIKSDDIIEITDEAIKSKILHECCIFEDAECLNEETGDIYIANRMTEFTSLPKAWDDDKGILMIDLGYVCDQPVDDEIFGKAKDQSEYAPLVIDHVERRVYFSLQGDSKMILNPATYDGWREGHIEMLAEFGEEE